MPVFGAEPNVRAQAGTLPVTELTTSAAAVASPSTMALSALSTAITATPVWYSCIAAAAAGVVLAWWTGLWWGEFLTDDGFRYLSAIPSLIATIAAALSFGRGSKWWKVSATLCTTMIVLLSTAFAPPPENAMGYDLLFSPMVQTGALGYGGYAYWFMGLIILFAVFGGMGGARSAENRHHRNFLAALSFGSLAAIGTAFLIVQLSMAADVYLVWATLGLAAAYLLAGVVFGTAVQHATIASSMAVASGAFGLVSTAFYLLIRNPDGAVPLGPLIMGVPLFLFAVWPGVAFLSTLLGSNVGRGLTGRRT
jgi:hypothetical protein